MQNFPYILSEYEEINNTLYTPLGATQRIKYTCLSVSKNYIILGSTSGSLYLFQREPCTFYQLIPLSEGAVHQVLISPDEKAVALSTTKGSICLVTLKPNVKLTTICNEHLGNKITSICWNENSIEVYSGDDTGKITVSVLSTFTVNGIFQSSSCCLMNLDSSIIQMSYSTSLLLISTKNRTYICDTVQEQYKQIGSKSRDGDFGACFYNLDNSILINNEDILKIFCARPSSRLWEVTLDGTVIKTHQFKEALAVAPLPVYRPKVLLNNKNFEKIWPGQSINFSQLLIINYKYIFSYTQNGLYIIDPINAAVILWSNEFKNISMAHVVHNKIYLMTSSGVFHCLQFSFIDSLIMKLYDQKLYDDCWILCENFREKLLQNNKKEKLETLALMISQIKSDKTPKKLESGIVIVNSSGNSNFNIDNNEFQNQSKLENNLSSLNLENSNNKNTDAQKNSENINGQHNQTTLSISNLQSDLQYFYSTNLQLKSSVTTSEFEEIIKTCVQFLHDIQIRYSDIQAIQCAKLHYKTCLLENITNELLENIESVEILKELTNAFMDINSSANFECDCGFPLPTFEKDFDKSFEPKYLHVGILLIKKLNNYNCDDFCLKMCNRVPYMWQEYLKTNTNFQFSNNFLKQCLLSRDNSALSIFLPILNNEQWCLVVETIKSIEKNQCVECGKIYNQEKYLNKEFSINWINIIQEIMKKQGIDFTLKFMFKVNTYLPETFFDKTIFQSIIFSKILDHENIKHNIEFNSEANCSSIFSPTVVDNISRLLNQDLEELKVKESQFGTGPHNWGMRYSLSGSTCPCCTLLLQTPVLLGTNGIALFSCGHAYHVNCMVQKQITKCYLH